MSYYLESRIPHTTNAPLPIIRHPYTRDPIHVRPIEPPITNCIAKETSVTAYNKNTSHMANPTCGSGQCYLIYINMKCGLNINLYTNNLTYLPKARPCFVE